MKISYMVHCQGDGERVVKNKAGKLVSKHDNSLGAALRASDSDGSEGEDRSGWE